MADPGQVAADFGFRTDDAYRFCEHLLTYVNLHTVAALVTAIRFEDYESAHRLVEIQKAMEHGPLFGPDAERIAAERKAIFDKLEAQSEKRAQKS